MTRIEVITQKISQSIANAYAILYGMGATPPAEESVENLAETAGTTKVVRFDAQELSTEQQAQARGNIGAASAEEVANLKTYVTPQMFGAVGDGETDDTAAFEQAFEYPCFIPAGTYLIKSTITVTHDVVGFSRGSVKIISGGCDTIFHAVDNTQLLMKNINIVGTYTETAILLENIRNSYFENIRIEKCVNGFRMLGNVWANLFDKIVITQNTNGFANDSNNSFTFDTTTIMNSYIGQCDSAFKFTHAGIDIIAGHIEECEVVFDHINIATKSSICCNQLNMENNGVLLRIDGGTVATNFIKFAFRDCGFYGFTNWFDKVSTGNISIYFDVTGGNVAKPTAIFTSRSTYCRWGTNLPDHYLAQTTPYKLCKCKTNAVFVEISIPVSLITDKEYVFPEQVYLSSINIPEGMTVTVHSYNGSLAVKTYTGTGTYKAITEPCYKLVFSEQPTTDIMIKVPRNANVVVV